MLRTLVFVASSVPIVWLSRRSLIRPSSHGFPRFWAFEAILGLVVLNAPYWFAQPLGAQQLASWFLLLVSIILVAWGVVLLRRVGSSRATIEESDLFGWENTERLVTTGVYRYIRHPMYSSLLFLDRGTFLKSVSIGTVLLVVLATSALVATAKAEEAENVARFGQEYRDYMKNTRRFVPFML